MVSLAPHLILKASFTVVLKCSLDSSMPGNQRLSSISVFHFILIRLNVSATAREIEEWVPGVGGGGGGWYISNSGC